jgi:hypothetical protein
MSPTKATKTPLSDLSPNTTSPSKSSSTDQKPSDNDLFKMPATAAFPIRNENTTNYISPSDAMMSPTTKKLSQIKGRRLAGTKTKQLNSRELFAKARAENDKKSASFESQSDLSSAQSTQTDLSL